jgi:acyl carrier protein
MGVLDSFALVDFVSVLEGETGIKVPDSDVNPANFQTIEAIERYVASRQS